MNARSIGNVNHHDNVTSIRVAVYLHMYIRKRCSKQSAIRVDWLEFEEKMSSQAIIEDICKR